MKKILILDTAIIELDGLHTVDCNQLVLAQGMILLTYMNGKETTIKFAKSFDVPSFLAKMTAFLQSPKRKIHINELTDMPMQMEEVERANRKVEWDTDNVHFNQLQRKRRKIK